MRNTEAALAAAQAKRDRVVTGFEDMLEVDANLHDCLAAVGRDYFSLRRTLVGAGRHDLVTRLRKMRDKDTAHLQEALGIPDRSPRALRKAQ